MDIKIVTAAQLAEDFSLSTAEILEGGVYFTGRENRDGRRKYKEKRCELKILSTGTALVFSSENAVLLEKLKNEYGRAPEWISEIGKLRGIDRLLAEYGQEIKDCHPFFVPRREPDYENERMSLVEDARYANIEWFEGTEKLNSFRDDPMFDQSLGFGEETPDMFAVAYKDNNGEIIATAGVSADSNTMWQIGVNVSEAARGRGLGTYLVRLAANETFRRGKVPFYGTADSHIISKRTALSAGFVPAWWESYSGDIKAE